MVAKTIRGEWSFKRKSKRFGRAKLPSPYIEFTESMRVRRFGWERASVKCSINRVS